MQEQSKAVVLQVVAGQTTSWLGLVTEQKNFQKLQALIIKSILT